MIAEVEMRDEPEVGMRPEGGGIGPVNHAEGGGPYRVVLREQEVEHDREPTLPDLEQALVFAYGTDFGVHSPNWISRFTDMTRQAASYRERRVLLAGDAAHVHSPAGGQGMNTGLQDAYNLAWKLALVISGKADDALLDSYEAERIPVAHRLLATTDRAFTLIVADTWVAGLLRTQIVARIAAFAMGFERVRRLAFLTISQIGIAYPESPLSRTLADLPQGAPRAGERFPWLRLKWSAGGAVEDLFGKLEDTRFNLLVFGQPAPPQSAAGTGDQFRVYIIPDDPHNAKELAHARIPSVSFYLLRPDGHVGLTGIRLEKGAVARYLSESRIGNRSDRNLFDLASV
jgi:hypothetical protein